MMNSTALLRRVFTGMMVALMVAGVGSCSRDDESGGGAAEVAETRADGTELSADDRAAAEFVQSRLAEHWIKHGSGWTTEFQQRNMLGEVMPGIPDVQYKQYRNLKFTIAPEQLTEAMRLNGSDYRGVASFEQSPVRYYRNRETWEGPQGWSQWSDGDLFFHTIAVERRNGKWLIQDDDLFVGIKPDPAMIPSGG